jgi:hypothetical protein
MRCPHCGEIFPSPPSKYEEYYDEFREKYESGMSSVEIAREFQARGIGSHRPTHSFASFLYTKVKKRGGLNREKLRAASEERHQRWVEESRRREDEWLAKRDSGMSYAQIAREYEYEISAGRVADLIKRARRRAAYRAREEERS